MPARNEIIKQVQLRLDELSPFDDIQDNPALHHIDLMLNDSTINLFRLLPYTRLPLKQVTGGNAGPITGSWVIPLPADYIKLGIASLTGWVRDVTELADADTIKLQGSKYTMGKENKPVVYLKRDSSSAMLYLYSTSASEPTAKVYIVVAKKPEDCPDDLIDAIAWQTASDVLLSIGKNDLAKTAQEKAIQHGV